MPSFGDGFDEFRDQLLGAAFRRLYKHHPEFVAQARSIMNYEEALQCVPPEGSKLRFKSFRAVLSLALELEMSVRNLVLAIRLFRVVPDPNFVREVGMTAHEWHLYHWRQWTIALSGSLECAIHLVEAGTANLHRYDYRAGKALRERLVGDLNKLREQNEEWRNIYAHGGSGAAVVADESPWEFIVAHLVWPSLESMYRPGPLAHGDRVAMLEGVTIQTIARLSAVLSDFTRNIEWDRVR